MYGFVYQTIPKCTQVEDIPTSPEKKGFVPQIVQDGVKNILGVVGGVLNSNRDGREHEAEEEPHKVNFTRLFEEAKRDQSLYEGYHLTFFEEDPGCRLDVAGYTAKVYWLWQTGQVCTQNCMNVLHFIPHYTDQQCAPLYLHGKETSLYYRLNGTGLDFGCQDSDCEECDFAGLHMDPDESGLCHVAGEEGSYLLGAPDIGRFF